MKKGVYKTGVRLSQFFLALYLLPPAPAAMSSTLDNIQALEAHLAQLRMKAAAEEAAAAEA